MQLSAEARALCCIFTRGVSSKEKGVKALSEFVLRIEGMHCGACIRRVNQALASADGVDIEEVRIGAARLSSAEDPPPVQSALAAIEKAGYVARLETLEKDTLEKQL
jgi:copper chaperone